jgi:glutaminase
MCPGVFMPLAVAGRMCFDEAAVSTGRLPGAETVATVVREAYEAAAANDDGSLADSIPALGRVSRRLFGVSLVGVDGQVHACGDTEVAFTIQSLSKPLVFAAVCQEIGPAEAQRLLGVNATGLPFNSVMAIELSPHRTTNPMVNAGAIAATSLVPGATPAARFEFIRDRISRFAGRRLEIDEEVYRCEAATNQRNRGIAKLLEGYGRLYGDALEATDVYTRQCALLVTARDVAVIAATLADGGVNPLTGERVIDADCAVRTLAVLATAGLYEISGDWLYDIGLPAKSGISGGLFTVAPGKAGLGVFAPPLDGAGNSVKGQIVARHLSAALGLNIFVSKAERVS